MHSTWDQGRLPHAILLAGPAGMGKRAFAASLARFVLCDEPDTAKRDCGVCVGCRLMAGQSHPDYVWAEVPEEKTTIGIDQIRQVTRRFEQTSYKGGFQVAVVSDADRMMRAASNSMLKTLEEPRGACLLILVSSRPAKLLPTIRSRCQTLRFARPDRARTLAWLQERQNGPQQHEQWNTLLDLAGGAPLRAVALREQGADELDAAFRQDLVGIMQGDRDPVAISQKWGKQPPSVWLRWLQTQVLAMIRARSQPGVGGQECDAIDLIQAAVNIKLPRLYLYLDDLIAAGWRTESTIRSDLMIAALLIPWANGLDSAPVYREG